MPAALPGLRHGGRPGRGRGPPLLPEPRLPGARVAGVRPLRRARRDGHRGRRLDGPRAAPRRRGLVKRRGDFFRLTVEDLEGARPLRAEERREPPRARSRRRGRRPLERIIAALGIPQVGLHDRDRACRPGSPREVPGRRRTGCAGPAALPRGGCATDEPERFAEVEGIGPTVSAALGDLVRDRRPGPRRARRPRRRRRRAGGAGAAAASRRIGGDRPAGGQDGRRQRHDRGLQSRGSRGGGPRRRRQGRRARCRRRPTISSPGRAPARSWPRPRSSASPSSTRPAFGGCWPARPPAGATRERRRRAVRRAAGDRSRAGARGRHRRSTTSSSAPSDPVAQRPGDAPRRGPDRDDRGRPARTSSRSTGRSSSVRPSSASGPRSGGWSARPCPPSRCPIRRPIAIGRTIASEVDE